jgi:hypothetical protein
MTGLQDLWARSDIDAVLTELRSNYRQINPNQLGCIGNLQGYTGYGIKTDIYHTQSGAEIPYCVEAWACCRKSQTKGSGDATFTLVLNRSRTCVAITGNSNSDGILIGGCGMYRCVRGPKTGIYQALFF